MSRRLRLIALLLALTLSQTSLSISQEPAELKRKRQTKHIFVADAPSTFLYSCIGHARSSPVAGRAE
jgi:lipopolysaccharide export system protein LptC